jgi:hypothetical protein
MFGLRWSFKPFVANPPSVAWREFAIGHIGVEVCQFQIQAKSNYACDKSAASGDSNYEINILRNPAEPCPNGSRKIT